MVGPTLAGKLSPKKHQALQEHLEDFNLAQSQSVSAMQKNLITMKRNRPHCHGKCYQSQIEKFNVRLSRDVPQNIAGDWCIHVHPTWPTEYNSRTAWRIGLGFKCLSNTFKRDQESVLKQSFAICLYIAFRTGFGQIWH